MQQHTTSPDDSRAAALFDRLANNRRAVRETVGRLAATLHANQEVRSESERLLDEVRAALRRLRESRAVVHARPAVTPPAPVLPRYTGADPDPIDVVRQQLHAAYAQSRDQAVRAELLASYDGFARSLAMRYRHRESLDDLVQVARIGLLHAIDRFDPAMGRPFPLFARITITGELKRHMRDKTWAMRVPRSMQEDYLNVMRAVDELTAEASDSPTMEALAERCGMSVERVVEAMELRVTQRALSIDVPTGPGPDEPVVELGQEELGFRQLENRQMLEQLLSRLPERDRRIVELRFMDELTQVEIAEQVGVSQMCVSRVLARTLGRLRLWARTAVQ